MILSLGIVIFTLFVVSFFVQHIQIVAFSSKFSNAIFNALLLFGSYALFVTNLRSIYIIPVVGLIFIGLIFKRINVKLNFKDCKQTFLLSSLVSALCLLLFYRKNDLLVPHEDYLFWIRVGLTNQYYGIENINVFYNLIDDSFHKSDLYHYLELWTMNFGIFFNRQSPLLNILFFAFPLGIILSIIGVKELIYNLFPKNLNKKIILELSSFLIIISFLFFYQPWDFLNSFLKISRLPISGMGLEWGNIKMIYIMNIVIALFLYLQKTNFETFVTLIFASFFYLPVLPMIIVTLLLWKVCLYFLNHEIEIKDFFILIAISVSFALYYSINGNHNGTTVSGFSIKEWFVLQNWIKYCPAILMKTILIPLFGLLPISYLIFKTRASLSSNKSFLFLVLLFLVCIGVWAVFIKNVDANQAFLLLFGAILPLIMILIIWYLLFIKRKLLFGSVLVILYIIPGIVHAIGFKTEIQKDKISSINYIKKLSEPRVLYIPEKDELKSVYDFNERVYTGINQFILYNSKINLFSVSASFQGDNLKISSLEMYNAYRGISPYYKECGYLDTSSKCFKDYLKKNKIDIICTKNKSIHFDGWVKDFENSDYIFYKLSMKIK